MKFQVPQFIEVEDKIFGPFTFKQFVYILGGVAGAYLFWRLMPIYIAVFFSIPTLLFGAMLAFYKVNNRPFIDVVESAILFVLSGKLYIWKKEDKKIEAKKAAEVESQQQKLYVPKLSDSKLKDLAWSLDINDTMYSRQAKNAFGNKLKHIEVPKHDE